MHAFQDIASARLLNAELKVIQVVLFPRRERLLVGLSEPKEVALRERVHGNPTEEWSVGLTSSHDQLCQERSPLSPFGILCVLLLSLAVAVFFGPLDRAQMM